MEIAPVVALNALAVGDLESALLGILADGQELGANDVIAGTGRAARSLRVAVPAGIARQAQAAGRLELADEEMTPLAELADLLAIRSDNADRSVMQGTLTPRRSRESGAGAAYRWPGAAEVGEVAGCVILDRPPMPEDEAALAKAWSSEAGGLLLIAVPDDASATQGVPTPAMLRLAEVVATAWSGAAKVIAVPVRWRGPQADAAVVAGLSAMVGVGALRMSELSSEGSQRWDRVRRDLFAAQADLDDLDPAVARELERWRPPRAKRGLMMVFTGLSGSGKSTVARAVAAAVEQRGDRTVSLLDGDVVRQLLSSGLGFDRESRLTNLRRIAFVGEEIARHGGIAMCAPIAPYAGIRAEMRAAAERVGDFVLIHINTPLEECERRDLKGLYAKARAGVIPEFTGISDPYEVPEDADLRIDTSRLSVQEARDQVLSFLVVGGWLSDGPSQP